jgi:hypothetical protein
MGWDRWFVLDSCGCPTGVDVNHKTADRAFNFLRTTLARPATRDGVEIVIDNRIDLSIHVQLLMARFAPCIAGLPQLQFSISDPDHLKARPGLSREQAAGRSDGLSIASWSTCFGEPISASPGHGFSQPYSGGITPVSGGASHAVAAN